MHFKLFNDSQFKSEEIDDRKTQFSVKFQLKFMQTREYPCYLIKGTQFVNPNTSKNEKFYVSPISQNLSIVVFSYDKSFSNFSLDILLSMKTNRADKERNLLICLPIWRKNQDILLSSPGIKNFRLTYSLQPNLAFGSIINTNVVKDEYVFI